MVLRRLTGFTLLPLLSLVTPFLLLPVVARVSGPAGWSSFVAGQAIGTIGATVVFWGWNVIGPVLAARAGDVEARTEVYAVSLRTRYLLLIVVVPVAVVVSALVATTGHRVDAAAMAAATTLLGLSPSWFGIGVGNPWLLFWYDTLPRVAAAVAAAALVWLTSLVWVYPVLLAVAVAGSLSAFRRRHVPGARGALVSPWPVARSLGDLRLHLGTAGINLAATAYASTPVPIATVALRAEVSSRFASADSLYRFALFTVTALGNAFQGWTLEEDSDQPVDRRPRHRAAWSAHLGLGVVGAVAFATLGPWATGLLFGSAVQAPRDVCVYYGVAFLFLSASSPAIRNVLLPTGRVRLVFGWTLASAVVGLALMGVAAASGWVAGIALGMAVSEALLFVGLLGPALRALASTGLTSSRVPEVAADENSQTSESGREEG